MIFFNGEYMVKNVLVIVEEIEYIEAIDFILEKINKYNSHFLDLLTDKRMSVFVYSDLIDKILLKKQSMKCYFSFISQPMNIQLETTPLNDVNIFFFEKDFESNFEEISSITGYARMTFVLIKRECFQLNKIEKCENFHVVYLSKKRDSVTLTNNGFFSWSFENE